MAQAALRNGTSVVEEIRARNLLDDTALLALLRRPRTARGPAARAAIRRLNRRGGEGGL
ncbi:hypothetical protein [Streptomyces sp. NPDC001292]|uniref:hypothetical protein n=1 Tax=Streptomyces sp. NPDC001292 TaxID=3364558 RepID=UPI0036CDA9D9